MLSDKQESSLSCESKTEGEKLQEYWKKTNLFEKIAYIGIFVFALMALVAFLAGRKYAGIISAAQIALILEALLLRKKILKAPNGWISIVVLVVAFVFTIPYFSLFRYVKYDWNTAVLSDFLPQPESPYGKILSNSEKSLSLEVIMSTDNQYSSYVEACREKGFSVDEESSILTFSACNDEGYKLSVGEKNNNEMYIHLEAPLKMSTITWPNSELANLLPVPKSLSGNITRNSEDCFVVYISDTTIEDFHAYVEACEEKGFTVDSRKDAKSFSAKNSDSINLSVEYNGGNVILISASQPLFTVTLKVDVKKNQVFSKYDVKLIVDGTFIDYIRHGDTRTIDVILKRGKHTISFDSAEDSTVDGDIEVEITKDETIKLNLSCTRTAVNVEILSRTP